jgi:hypothetical protein
MPVKRLGLFGKGLIGFSPEPLLVVFIKPRLVGPLVS